MVINFPIAKISLSIKTTNSAYSGPLLIALIVDDACITLSPSSVVVDVSIATLDAIAIIIIGSIDDDDVDDDEDVGDGGNFVIAVVIIDCCCAK